MRDWGAVAHLVDGDDGVPDLLEGDLPISADVEHLEGLLSLLGVHVEVLQVLRQDVVAVEEGLDVPEHVEGQLLGLVLAGHIARIVLGLTQPVLIRHLQHACDVKPTPLLDA